MRINNQQKKETTRFDDSTDFGSFFYHTKMKWQLRRDGMETTNR